MGKDLIKIKFPILKVKFSFNSTIRSQFYDLIKILEVGGPPESTKYLFLGDFVDRGSFSIEVIILLYAIKVYFPKNKKINR
jgi:hypothetical protein